ncbi:MAG: family N-acetyltransferase [Herbinix sp.]|jgi:GNAT superfamily N-acetyltransferase|nr:family N-acetyltransferase [Herbinix sp.]
MIQIEEIPIEKISNFWKMHYEYLIQDEIISDDEDKKYFQSDEYRSVIKEHMLRNIDKHHLAYFVEKTNRIGAVSYCIYQSEDGKCFILDYWMFPQFRGKGTGHKCFEALENHTKKDGALYYEINCDGRQDRMRFWKSIGFVQNGIDEFGVELLIKR